MLPGGRGIDGLDRLDVRLVALLGLALLPIGVIAMVQTYRVIDHSDEVARSALVGHTLNAVTLERETLVQMRGAAQIAADLLPSEMGDLSACSSNMEQFTRRFPTVAFAGFIDLDGIVRCGSTGVGRDVSDQSVFQRFQREDSEFFASTHGVISNQPVVVIVQPVRREGASIGFFSVSVPQAPLSVQSNEPRGTQPLGTLTLTKAGDILSVSLSDAIDDLAPLVPPLETLQVVLSGGTWDVTLEAPDGNDYIYTVVPIIPSEVYAISIWREASVSTGGLTAASAILFPLLMWMVSIGVAYFAVHRLVVRHIRRLRQRIRAFTTSRRVLPSDVSGDLPSELREVVEAFEQLTERIVRDEADLENSLHEKDVLLKEVHHRVKNNLQLISSMMNMQMRKTKSEETRELLHRLQDRILGLATIHRNLYRSSVLSRVETDVLIRDLVSQIAHPRELAEIGVTLNIKVDPVELYPDQAVPLSLLVTEVLTNALKYVGKPNGHAATIDLTLAENDGRVTLECRNTRGASVSDNAAGLASGLGTQLMQAFVMQLDGRMEQTSTDSTHAIRLEFDTSEFIQEL
ncbi:sensor histidine kinase [Maribius pontilimi]|uniref:histidine kinase n=1 Tax=Palleronia pontilimi TaxID=1964209 RepID=A0A934IDR8_9RHOB|nr:sensor histidine kinase [Palleronia pontilimi]MBJ3761620.1 sensor histidine kinase [Palleronia pontilimi]